MAYEFKLPQLGENIESGRVVSLRVTAGQVVTKDSIILELETDKAVIEVPAPLTGSIKNILIREGDEIAVGQTILIIAEGADDAAPEINREPLSSVEAEKTVESEASLDINAGALTGESNKSRLIEVRIPNLGENIQSGMVAKILVGVAQQINKDQGLIKLETDKAVVEIPAEINGVVSEILVREGEQAAVGQVFVRIETTARQSVPAIADVKTDAMRKETPPLAASRPREAAPISLPDSPLAKSSTSVAAPAAPSVRRFAREIGIDVNQVPGSGVGGRISVEDVQAHSRAVNRQGTGGIPIAEEALPDFSRWGAVERRPMNKVRETTARHLGYAWASIPHVTQFDKADITNLEKLRQLYSAKTDKAGAKLTMTAILLKAVESALKKFPQFNVSFDRAQMEIIYKKYFNIGVAVDTDRGLLVPVIRDVNRKNILQLAAELSDVSARARERKLTLEEMQGGNFTISNLGGIGGAAFTPIINAPEAAILGVSRSAIEPKYIDGQFAPRMMLPLSLSYDHRLIDGADAARFLRWICEALEQPFLLSMEG
jgi:pyruvate dehydrogenase E2 component (dihydrolipoamide acetyltransferase)